LSRSLHAALAYTLVVIKPWRALLTLLLALCLPLQGVAASGGWWCALQGHDPLQMGVADLAHGTHHAGPPVATAEQAGPAPHGGHGHHGAAAADAAENIAHAGVTDGPDAMAVESNQPTAGPDAGPSAPAGTASGAGSCSVCAACCAVAWLPPASWHTPEVPDATPWAPAQAGWPPRLTLANLDRPPRSLSV
jgi:hypothetical protein